MSRRRLVPVVLLAMTLAAPVGWAHEWHEPLDPVEEFMAEHRLHPAFQKLGRGVSNVLWGWLEVPLNIHKRFTRTDTAGSVVTGLVVGVFKGGVRTAVGVYETVTFFIPYPENFAPILPTLEYFQQPPAPPSPRRSRLLLRS